MLLPFILQARRKFLFSIIADNSLYLVRLVTTIIFALTGYFSLNNSLWAFVIGGIAGIIIGLLFIKPDFLKTKPEISIYKNFFKFSGWIAVNRIISAISGRLDIQMLIVLAGSLSTGLYSIPSRLSGFIIVLTSSFSSVLAPRLAGFKDFEKEKKYIIKASLALIPIIFGLIVWILIAKPFILILFGYKYIDSVPVFQALALSMIPFVLTAPSVSAIIYSLKKTVYIGAFSFFQIIAIFVLNYYLIPIYGVFGPVITYAITNSILALYTWAIVVRHYWFSKRLS